MTKKKKKKKKKKTLCPVTVLVDYQVSDRCPWATCSYSHHIFVQGYGREGVVGDKTIQFKSQDRSGRPSVVLKGRQAAKNTGEIMIEKVIYYGDPDLLLE